MSDVSQNIAKTQKYIKSVLHCVTEFPFGSDTTDDKDVYTRTIDETKNLPIFKEHTIFSRAF